MLHTSNCSRTLPWTYLNVDSTHSSATMPAQTPAEPAALAFSKELTLHYPLHEILPYLENELVAGEYLIPLTQYAVTLLKDEQGKIHLFDPNYGTIDLSADDSKAWFLALLQNHKIHLIETLSLLKINHSQIGNQALPENIEIAFPEEKPKLTFEKGPDRWGVAAFTWRAKTIHLPWDCQTGYIYNHDSKNLLRAKCFLLIPRTWIDTTLRTIYHAAMAVFRTLALPLTLIQNRQKTQEQLRKIGQAVADIFRAPLYALMGTFSALYGLFKPLDGRRLYGYFERCLNRQQEDLPLPKKHYVAPCFKPWNFASRHDAAATIENLKQISLRLKYFTGHTAVEMLCGWRHALPCCK